MLRPFFLTLNSSEKDSRGYWMVLFILKVAVSGIFG